MNSTARVGSQFDEKLLELSSQIDQFECYPYAHGLLIAEVADAIAAKIGMGERDRSMIQQAALLHDLGELAMKRDYIGAARALTETEKRDMQRHTIIGEQEASRRGLGKGVQLLIRWHHEWWNGKGYPDGLAGDEIPIGARILRLSDGYASMTAQRPHRNSVSEDEAGRHVSDLAGIEYDPVLVKTLLDLDLHGAVA